MENKENSLAKSSGNLLPILKIDKPADLLKAATLKTRIEKFGEEKVLNTISAYMVKATVSLGIQMTNEQCKIIAEDILAKYEYDSLEDVIECLKKGRKGVYGFGHNSRNTMNMMLISEWMNKHLEDKSAAREQQQWEKKEIHQQTKGISPKVQGMIDNFRKEKEKERPKKATDKKDMIRSLALVKSKDEVLKMIQEWTDQGVVEDDIQVLRQVLEDRKKWEENQIKQSEQNRRNLGLNHPPQRY